VWLELLQAPADVVQESIITRWKITRRALSQTSWLRVQRKPAAFDQDYGRLFMSIRPYVSRTREVHAVLITPDGPMPREVKTWGDTMPRKVQRCLDAAEQSGTAENVVGYVERANGIHVELVRLGDVVVLNRNDDNGIVDPQVMSKGDFDLTFCELDEHADRDEFVLQTNKFIAAVHMTAKQKGWWPDTGRNDGELMALVHSEVSEALEAMRSPLPDGKPQPSEKIPGFTAVEEELADVLIRVFDFAGARGLRLAQAIVAKAAYNQGRSHRHGNKRF
jgi:NTP pyrophosphatase (non-canonical NTP hydrolase)